MKKVILWMLLLSCLASALFFSGCDEEAHVYIPVRQRELRVGETYQIEVWSGRKNSQWADGETRVFISENPDVAEVDDRGVVTALKPGEALIRVWLKNNPQKQDTFHATVKYEVRDEADAVIQAVKEPVSAEDMKEYYSFLEKNGYIPSCMDWGVPEIYEAAVNREGATYLFSEAYVVGYVNDDNLLVYADKSQADVTLGFSTWGEIGLNQAAADALSLPIDKFSVESQRAALEEMQPKIQEDMQKYGNKIFLSALPSEYAYSIVTKANYAVVATVKYYSNGTLRGEANPTSELLAMDKESFLKTYTYTSVTYDVEVFHCGLVIERCAPEVEAATNAHTQ